MSPSLPRTVLVTGGAGLIGAALARVLVSAGARVVALDDGSGGAATELPDDPRLVKVVGDVRDRRLVASLVAAEPRAEAIVHLAARVGVRTVLADPLGAAAANLDGVRSLTEALAALPTGRRPRVIAASSSEVYAESSAQLHEGAPLRAERDGRWAYAASKLDGERVLDAVRGLWPVALAPVHLRFFNVVGPGQDAASGMVLPRFVEAARAGAPLVVYGDGAQVRTFAHVDDVAADVARLALGEVAHASGGPLNLGGYARATVSQLAELVAARATAFGHPAPEVVRVDPSAVAPRFQDVRYRVPDLSRAAALGLARRARTLRELVDDMFQRHPRGARVPVLASETP